MDPGARQAADVRRADGGRGARSADAEGPSEADRRSGLTLAEVAGLVGGEIAGDGGERISSIRPIAEAGPGDLAFFASGRYAKALSRCRASAFLVARGLADRLPAGASAVLVDDPHAALPALLARLRPSAPEPSGIHPTAVVGRGVQLGEAVSIGAFAVLGEGAAIGAGARIGAHSVVGAGSAVGAESTLHPHVVIYPGCRIGRRCVLHSGARVGSDGFGFVFREGRHEKIPQVGGVEIGDEVEIGANSTIDRGSLGETVIGSGSKLDNLVHIAHNVRVGARSLFAALVGIAGSTTVGRDVWMGGKVGVSDHLTIGDGARLAIASKVMRDVPGGVTMSGHPARPHREQMRRQAGAARAWRLERRVRRLEKAAEAGAAPRSPDGGAGAGPGSRSAAEG